MKNVLGLIGLLALSSSANAQDFTTIPVQEPDYTQLSYGEAIQQLHHKVIKVTYESFESDIKQYWGAVILFTTTTCPHSDAEHLNRNIAYLQLINEFSQSIVNGLPLKFAWFDICGRSGATQLGINGLETSMYLDGDEIDKIKGESSIEDTITNSFLAKKTWIESNLLGIPYMENGEEKKVIYNGTKKASTIPFFIAPIHP